LYPGKAASHVSGDISFNFDFYGASYITTGLEAPRRVQILGGGAVLNEMLNAGGIPDCTKGVAVAI
jgi:hypothetical protein